MRDEEISNDIKKLTFMFIEKEIDDIRWEINNFATKISEGKPCNKDSFQHCIHIYEKYEKILHEKAIQLVADDFDIEDPSVMYQKILEENGLDNGEVELSMELIYDAYKKKLKEGELWPTHKKS